MLAKLEEAIEELCGTDPAALGDAEAMVVIHRSLARLEAVAARAAAAFEATVSYRSDGAYSASAWLATHCYLPKATARRRQADPDGADKSAEEQLAARRWHYSRGFGGSWVGDLLLDPINGAVVANQLKAIEKDLFDADWAEARERLVLSRVSHCDLRDL